MAPLAAMIARTSRSSPCRAGPPLGARASPGVRGRRRRLPPRCRRRARHFPSGCLNFAAFRSLTARAARRRSPARRRVARDRGRPPPTSRSSPASIDPADADLQGAADAFHLRSVSEGMAQNAALALCAGLELGVTPAALQARLTAWHPSSLRGELQRAGDKLFYLDCYNANPASMADALEAFGAVAPAGRTEAVRARRNGGTRGGVRAYHRGPGPAGSGCGPRTCSL